MHCTVLLKRYQRLGEDPGSSLMVGRPELGFIPSSGSASNHRGLQNVGRSGKGIAVALLSYFSNEGTKPSRELGSMKPVHPESEPLVQRKTTRWRVSLVQVRPTSSGIRDFFVDLALTEDQTSIPESFRKSGRRSAYLTVRVEPKEIPLLTGFVERALELTLDHPILENLYDDLLLENQRLRDELDSLNFALDEAKFNHESRKSGRPFLQP